MKCKEAFFTLRLRLVCNTNKAPLQIIFIVLKINGIHKRIKPFFDNCVENVLIKNNNSRVTNTLTL